MKITKLCRKRSELGYYLPNELITLLPITQGWLRDWGPPTHVVPELGKRRHYSLADAAAMVDLIQQPRPVGPPLNMKRKRQEAGLFNKTEAAKQCSCTTDWLTRNYMPQVRYGVRRYYNQADLDKIRFMLDHPTKNHHCKKLSDDLAEQGYFSMSSAARKFGVPRISWGWYINHGVIPRPTHRIGTYWYYTQAECEEIMRVIHARKAARKLRVGM